MTVGSPIPGLCFEHRWAAARWLMDRHPALARLLSRAPGLIDHDGDPDVDLLALTLNEYEQHVAAWTLYEQRRPAPGDQLRHQIWQDAGPKAAPLVAFVGCLSPSERARLRMLATFSVERIGLNVLDFATLDASGRLLLADWTTAVMAS